MNVTAFPTKKCCICGGRATETLELIDGDSGQPVAPKLFCFEHFPRPLTRDQLALLIDDRDATITDLRKALAIVKAELDHWHGLVSRADRVQFPFDLKEANVLPSEER